MILVVNAGSSSVKVALFDPQGAEVLRGEVTEVGGNGRLALGAWRAPSVTQAGLDERDVQRESALSDRHALRRVTQRHLLHETDLTVGGEAERTQVTGLHTELSEPGSGCRDG